MICCAAYASSQKIHISGPSLLTDTSTEMRLYLEKDQLEYLGAQGKNDQGDQEEALQVHLLPYPTRYQGEDTLTCLGE
jgi:hypothetical protein